MTNFLAALGLDADTQTGLVRGAVLILSYMLLRPQLERFLAWINGTESAPSAAQQQQDEFLARLKARAEQQERKKLLERKEQEEAEARRKKKAATGKATAAATAT